MKPHARTWQPDFRSAARSVVALVLALAFVSATVPFSTGSATSICRMDCCAGKPAHAAGTCAHGACDVDLTTGSKPQSASIDSHSAAGDTSHADHAGTHVSDAPPNDIASHHAHDAHGGSSTHDAHGGSSTPDGHGGPSAHEHTTDRPLPPANIAASAFTKGCPPDCGAATAVYSNQVRPRETGLSHVQRPRPPSTELAIAFRSHSSSARDVLCRRCAPRGPPLTLA